MWDLGIIWDSVLYILCGSSDTTWLLEYSAFFFYQRSLMECGWNIEHLQVSGT